MFGSRNALAHTNKKPAYQLADTWECIDGKQIDKSPMFDPKHPYEKQRSTSGIYVSRLRFGVFRFQFETHGDSTKCWNYMTNQRVDNLEATHAYATFTGICWRKYANIEDKDALNDCDMNTILIRYPEVLLTYAEAKIKIWRNRCIRFGSDQQVRQRPSVKMPPITTTDPNELFYAVARERKYEFSGEGLRLFDIRRWKIAETVMNQPLFR